MDMSDFRPQFHIAQQSRRDKLRIQQDFTFSHHNLGPYADGFPQDYDSADVRTCRSGNLCYDPSEICSEMINFSANPLFKDPEKRGGDAPPPPFQSFPRDHHPTSFNTSAAAAAAASSDPQFFNTWKSVGLQPTSDWAANYSTILNSNPISVLDVKPNYLENQELHSPSDMNGAASSIYQNTLQELVTSSNVQSFGLEFASLSQKSDSGHFSEFGGSELLLLPDQLRLKDHSDLINRPIHDCSRQWSGCEELDRDLRMVAHDHSKALSLSLSSVPSPKVHEPQIAEKDFQTRDVQDSRNWNHGQNLSTGGRVVETHALTHRNPGPLGPFTGYSTILRSSRFLRPAQQLLEELCCISRPRAIEIREVSDEILEDARVSSEVVTDGENGTKGVVSPFAFDGCSEKRREAGGTSCSTDAHGSENFQRKAKLLFMQDEVWKRNKQYHQQMQMVVSSFESVAGLNAATPYVSLALKAISKHFRSLKNAISDQIKSIKNSLGEEFSSPPSGGGTSSSKGDANVSMLKFFDQSFQEQKGSGSNNMGSLEGQHIWRPQRGLPERAVSILRAWLFDHFLHPYPTDTDKHMLATQTGLTRNQVSNWFINARVRVWKPMVEEIHMLETKGPSDSGKTAAEGCNNEGDGCSIRGRMCAKQVEFPREEEADSRSNAGRVWNQEKRSRIEYDGSLMGLVGPSGAIEMGSVSLTLGLRQSAENGEQGRNLRCYGGQIIRDFVG